MGKILSRFRSKNKPGVPDPKNAQQNQALQEESGTNTSLGGNDGSNEDAKKSSTTLLTENTPIRELWKVAYEKLQEEDGALIKKYESKLQTSVVASLMQHLPFKANMGDQMEAILRIKMDENNKNASSLATVDEFAQLFLKVVDSANDYISNAASANPYTSIAWTGVSLVLPVS